MKKTFLVSSFIFFILLLTSCTIGHHVNNMTSYMESVDGLHYSLTPKLYYFDKVDNINEYKSSLFEKYDFNYFKKQSLFVITLIDNSANSYTVDGIKNGNISIYKDFLPVENTECWTLILEISDKVSDNLNHYVTMNDRSLHGHAYKKTIISPTCKHIGYTLNECVCGDSFESDVKNKIDCIYEENVCTMCGNNFNETSTPEEIDFELVAYNSTKNYFKTHFSGLVSTYEEFYQILKDEYKTASWIKEKFTEDYFKEYSVLALSKNNLDHLYNVVVTEILKQNNELFVDLYKKDQDNTTNVVFSLLIQVKKSDIEGVQSVEFLFNQYEYSYVIYPEIISGCEVWNEYELIINNKDHDISDMLEFYNAEAFIDLETLTVYQDVLNISKETHLEIYNSKVDDSLIISYLARGNNFKFGPYGYIGENLEPYELKINDLGNFEIIVDDILYEFENDGSTLVSNKHYNLLKVSANHNLFEKTYEEVVRTLDILFGSQVHGSNKLKIEVSDGSFVISYIHED